MNLGTFTDVVHGHDANEQIRWFLEWKLPKTLKIVHPMERSKKLLFSGDILSTQCEVGLRQARLWPYRLAYSTTARSSVCDYGPPRTRTSSWFQTARNSDSYALRAALGAAAPGQDTPVSETVRNYYQNSDFLGDFELEYENRMDSLYYLGPLREYPRREYHWAGSSPEDVGQRGERTVDAILAPLVTGS